MQFLYNRSPFYCIFYFYLSKFLILRVIHFILLFIDILLDKGKNQRKFSNSDSNELFLKHLSRLFILYSIRLLLFLETFCEDDVLIIEIMFTKFCEKIHPFRSQTRFHLTKLDESDNGKETSLKKCPT